MERVVRPRRRVRVPLLAAAVGLVLAGDGAGGVGVLEGGRPHRGVDGDARGGGGDADPAGGVVDDDGRRRRRGGPLLPGGDRLVGCGGGDRSGAGRRVDAVAGGGGAAAAGGVGGRWAALVRAGPVPVDGGGRATSWWRCRSRAPARSRCGWSSAASVTTVRCRRCWRRRRRRRRRWRSGRRGSGWRWCGCHDDDRWWPG